MIYMIKRSALVTIVIIASALTGCAGQPASLLPAVPVPEPVIVEEKILHIDDQPKDRKMVALTFDDGPGEFTDRILDLLEEHGGRATFFVLGSLVEENQDIVRRTVNLGSEVANHTWSHKYLADLTPAAIIWEIEATSSAITAAAGHSPPIMRPPFGRTNNRVIQIAKEMGYSIINWTVDTKDWKYRNAAKIYRHIMDNVKDGSIILLHDIHAATAQAMEKAIPRLIEEGYQLVTVSELLKHFHGSLEPGRIYGVNVHFE